MMWDRIAKHFATSSLIMARREYWPIGIVVIKKDNQLQLGMFDMGSLIAYKKWNRLIEDEHATDWEYTLITDNMKVEL